MSSMLSLFLVCGICSSFVLGIHVFISDSLFLQMGSLDHANSSPKLATTLFFCSVFSVAFSLKCKGWNCYNCFYCLFVWSSLFFELGLDFTGIIVSGSD